MRSGEEKTLRGSLRGLDTYSTNPPAKGTSHNNRLVRSGAGAAVRVKKCEEKRGAPAQEEWRAEGGARGNRECLSPGLRKARRGAIGGMGASWTMRRADDKDRRVQRRRSAGASPHCVRLARTPWVTSEQSGASFTTCILAFPPKGPRFRELTFLRLPFTRHPCFLRDAMLSAAFKSALRDFVDRISQPGFHSRLIHDVTAWGTSWLRYQHVHNGIQMPFRIDALVSISNLDSDLVHSPSRGNAAWTVPAKEATRAELSANLPLRAFKNGSQIQSIQCR